MRDVMSWRGRHPGGMGDGSRWSVGGKGGTTTGTSVEKRVAPRQGEWRLHKLILPYKTPQKPNVSRTRWPYVSAIPPFRVRDGSGGMTQVGSASSESKHFDPGLDYETPYGVTEFRLTPISLRSDVPAKWRLLGSDRMQMPVRIWSDYLCGGIVTALP